LRKKVSELLGSKQLRVVESSAPKQTETTQRWKVALDGEGVLGPLHTKIEFSRRRADGETAFDPVDPALIGEHGIAPVLATHYTAGSAFAQKIRALARRPETQARDLPLTANQSICRPGSQYFHWKDMRTATPTALGCGAFGTGAGRRRG
jgi:hypothetical protein